MFLLMTTGNATKELQKRMEEREFLKTKKIMIDWDFKG